MFKHNEANYLSSCYANSAFIVSLDSMNCKFAAQLGIEALLKSILFINFI